VDQESDDRHQNENLVSCPPILECFIKEEPRDKDDSAEESWIIAYPPIPTSAVAIKRELTDHEEIDLGIHEVIK